jgi:hypothetical protein
MIPIPSNPAIKSSSILKKTDRPSSSDPTEGPDMYVCMAKKQTT